MAESRIETGMSDDLITCPICFERFKSPKSLPCLHTYCKGCLHTYISKAVSENKPKVGCPICRYLVLDFAGQDVNQWIESLPTNFIVNTLIEREEMQNGKRNCDFCLHLGKSISATMWCQECSEAYCEDCSQGHNFHKMFRKHTLMPIKDALDNIYLAVEEDSFDCTVHRNRKIELYCFDHAEPCCLTCMTVHHRKCDKVTTLEEAAENFRNDPTFVSFTKRMKDITFEIREEITCRDETKRNFSSQLSQMRDQVKTIKDDMARHIEMLYNKIENDITAVEKQQQVDDQSAILTHKKIQLELLTKTLETLKTTSSDLSLFIEFHKMKGKQKEFEEFMDQYKSSRKHESVEYVCSETVRKFKSVVSTFGEVRVVDSLSKEQALKSATVDYTSRNLKEIVTIAETGARFTDAVFICTDTILAVSDEINAIWAFDSRGRLLAKSDLPSNPWALTVVDTNLVVVTLHGQKCLQFLTYNESIKRLSKGKRIHMNEQPLAIAYGDNCFFVTFQNKVRKLNLHGRIINEITIEKSNAPYGISYFNANIIVADHFEPNYFVKVITWDSTPLVKYQKKCELLKNPFGVTTDPDGNIYVVGYGSNNVIQLSQCGEVLREILPSTSGFKTPFGINFSLDGMKVILTHEVNKITLFEFQ